MGDKIPCIFAMSQTTSAPHSKLGCAVPMPSPMRRCQILLASAARHKPSEIERTLRCAPQTGRNVLHAFDARGLACVQRGSNVPITVEPVLNAEKREQVRAILHHSPRTFSQPAKYLDPQAARGRGSRAGPE